MTWAVETQHGDTASIIAPDHLVAAHRFGLVAADGRVVAATDWQPDPVNEVLRRRLENLAGEMAACGLTAP